jgi:hypothetical protein
VWQAKGLSFCDRLFGGMQTGLFLVGVDLCVRQRDQHAHSQREVAVDLGHRPFQQASHFEKTVAVETHDGQPRQSFRAEVAGRKLLDGLLQHGRCACPVAGIEMVRRRLQSTTGGIAAEPDRQVHQLGGGRGGAAEACRLRRLVQRPKRDVVTPGRGQRQMPRPHLGFVDDLGEPSMAMMPLLSALSSSSTTRSSSDRRARDKLDRGRRHT